MSLAPAPHQMLVQSLVIFVIAALLAIITAMSAFLLTRNARVLEQVQQEQKAVRDDLATLEAQIQAQQYAVGLELQELAFKQILNKTVASRVENLQLLHEDELDALKKQLVQVAAPKKR